MNSPITAVRGLPGRAARGLAVSAVLLGAALGTATQASAGTDVYCSGCQILNGSANGIVDRYPFYLVGSYVHYLGSGDRFLGAGSIDYAGYVTGYNEVNHPYAGDHYIRATAVNLSGNTYVTVNAHATF